MTKNEVRMKKVEAGPSKDSILGTFYTKKPR